MRLLQRRVNAVRQILHSGMPSRDKLGCTKFQFQLLLCFEHGQPVCRQKDPNPITCHALLQIIAPTKIQAAGR